MSKYTKYKNTHSLFFTLFKKDEFFIDFDHETKSILKDYSKIKDAFRYNLESVISVLCSPITLSVTRTKLFIFDKLLSSEMIRNSPMPEDLYETKEDFEKEKTNGEKKSVSIATNFFLKH